MKRFLLLFALLAAPLFADAEKARAALEAVVRKDYVVSVRTPSIRYADTLSAAERQLRDDRLAKDWPEFLRKFTEASATSSDGRALKSAVFWKEFFNGSSSDDIMRGADRWTSTLLSTAKSQRAKVELESDAAVRSRMLGRIDRVIKDLEAWRANGNESRRARSNMGASVVDLIAPL